MFSLIISLGTIVLIGLMWIGLWLNPELAVSIVIGILMTVAYCGTFYFSNDEWFKDKKKHFLARHPFLRKITIGLISIPLSILVFIGIIIYGIISFISEFYWLILIFAIAYSLG